ncbi:MAG TPA: PEP-CTERM sorting domain-containing protein [Candidatus Limnocylindrales bacterium]|nr:PEP-CTERM sorting domain-containing protein [Candidatus Limnocylindrales bacterium]
MKAAKLSLFVLSATLTASASTYFFSTGTANGNMAMASRPDSSGKVEIEAADDFFLTDPTLLTSATFTGLLSNASTSDISRVIIEIYQVFPADSDVGRTSGPPTFSTTEVPTRVNSPSDVQFDSRDSSNPLSLTFTSSNLGLISASNSVLNGINPKPLQTTGGDGAVRGSEVTFNVNFVDPLNLAGGHYFFVPQVELANGDFYWLSGSRPITSPGTPFPSGVTDLQAWIRNDGLAPDWLRVGTDIVGGNPAPTFNGAFTLSGETVPEPSMSLLLGIAIAGLSIVRRPVR